MNRLPLFPITAQTQNNSLTIAGQDLSTLAAKYGTPLYLYDRATMDSAVAVYKSALELHYPAPSSITYAGKAFLNRAVAQWTQLHGLYVDCASEGEIGMALAGGVPRERILAHGVNKSSADLKAAANHAGIIVVDNLTELKRIAGEFPPSNRQLPKIWLRLLPGLAVQTHHAHTQTGQHDSKFGMTSAEIMEAARFCKTKNLNLNGLHFHQGSNFRDAAPLRAAIELGLALAAEIGFTDGWRFSPGGGWGVAYHEDELPQPDAADYARMIAESVGGGAQARNLPLPHLHLEPGRSLVARAGVAVYRVGAIKRRGEKVWILTDGGMTDNPRHAMYGARYSCLAASNPNGELVEKVSIAGPYCESGDVVIEDLPMPKLEVGDLVVIPASGAYHLSMSSNYNGSRKPAVLLLEEGQARLIQRRETLEDLLRRDLGL